MGKWGRQWKGHTKKTCVEDCAVIDIRLLAKAGFTGTVDAIHPNTRQPCGRVQVTREPDDSLHLVFTDTDGQETTVYTVLDPLPLAIGGARARAVCPLCSQTCYCLYLPPEETDFGCKECLDLTYRARQQHKCGELTDQQIMRALEKGRPQRYRKRQ